MVERFKRFSLAIAEIDRYWHRIAGDEMEKYGLKATHSVYLLSMLDHPQGLTAARLGEICGKDKADVSRMVSILEKHGLICKQGVSGSQYRACLQLTQTGREAAQKVRNRASLAVELASRGISPEDRAALYRSLETIVNNLQSLSQSGLPTGEA